MSDLPISSPYRNRPDAPVSDAERNQLSARLNDAFTAGQLNDDEYRARLDQLFAAERMGDLVPVVVGLPPLQTYTSPAIVAESPGTPGELAEARNGSSLTLVTAATLVGVVLLIAILLVILL